MESSRSCPHSSHLFAKWRARALQSGLNSKVALCSESGIFIVLTSKPSPRAAAQFVFFSYTLAFAHFYTFSEARNKQPKLGIIQNGVSSAGVGFELWTKWRCRPRSLPFFSIFMWFSYLVLQQRKSVGEQQV